MKGLLVVLLISFSSVCQGTCLDQLSKESEFLPILELYKSVVEETSELTPSEEVTAFLDSGHQLLLELNVKDLKEVQEFLEKVEGGFSQS